jgi:hypothetical protein
MRSKYGASALSMLNLAILASTAFSQSGLQPPPETIKLVVGTVNKEHKMVLSDKGHALEVPLSFPMIGRDAVAIEAALGEQGRFDIELINTKAAVEVKNVRTEEGLGRAEVVRKVQPMSTEELLQQRDEQLEELAGKAAVDKARQEAENARPEDLRRFLVDIGFGELRDKSVERLRSTYVKIKPFSGKGDLLRKKLGEAAAANPRRFTPQDKKSWESMKVGELYEYYRMVLQTEIAEDYLKRCGLDYDRSTRNAAEKVIPMFIAMHALMTGNTPTDPEEAKAAKEAMTGGSATLLRQAITADLRLRIYSGTESTDANAQWFNAQRVACRATGASSIRVEGTLDPDKGDSVDWWIIERWDPASITFTTSSEGEVQFDPPQVVDGAARLRVAAGTKAARYWFEMKTDRGDLRVVIHESHIPAESKFPY